MAPHSRFSALIFCCVTFASRFVFSLLGSLHGSVELPCVYNQLPDAIEKINVYWQLRNHTKDLVVAAAMKGVVDTKFVDERFKGRAHLNPEGLQAGNFNLSLRNLSLHDSGTYVCIILWSPSYTDIFNNTTVELEVTAEFSTPLVDIPELGKLLYGQEVNLTCKSQGGLELPIIMWINSNDGSRIQIGRVHEVIHQDGDFVNVMSTITLNITSNINISCVIVTKNGNLTSQNSVKLGCRSLQLEKEISPIRPRTSSVMSVTSAFSVDQHPGDTFTEERHSRDLQQHNYGFENRADVRTEPRSLRCVADREESDAPIAYTVITESNRPKNIRLCQATESANNNAEAAIANSADALQPKKRAVSRRRVSKKQKVDSGSPYTPTHAWTGEHTKMFLDMSAHYVHNKLTQNRLKSFCDTYERLISACPTPDIIAELCDFKQNYANVQSTSVK